MARRPFAVNPSRPLTPFLRRWRAVAQIAGTEIIRAKIGQLAFQAFDVEPQGLAATEHQYRAAAGRLGRMKLDPNQFQHIVGCLQIDIARLGGQHAVETQRRYQAPWRGFAGKRLFPIQPVHAYDQPLLALPPDDIGGLDAGVLHMRRNDREVLGIERDQFELRRHRVTTLPIFLTLNPWRGAASSFAEYGANFNR